jgi:hypothetical protein
VDRPVTHIVIHEGLFWKDGYYWIDDKPSLNAEITLMSRRRILLLKKPLGMIEGRITNACEKRK